MTRRSVCLAAALVAGLPPLMAQERTGERNLLVEGWLVELLDRNYQDAAKKYRETALEDQNPTVFRLVALGRIYEIGLIGDTGLDLDTLEQDLRTRRMSERPRSFARSDDQRRRDAETLQKEFEDALSMPAGPEREAALTELRGRVDSLIEARNRDIRPWVRIWLQAAEPDQREQSRQRAPSDMRRQNRMRAAEVLRLRLDGQHEQAERLSGTVRVQRPPNRRNEPLLVVDPKQTLGLAIERLEELLGRERADISAEERQNLKRLLERLQSWNEGGSIEEAIAFLRTLPLYDIWLLTSG